MMERVLGLGLVVATFGFLTPVSGANLVVDPSFEDTNLATSANWRVFQNLTLWSTPYNYVEIQRNGLYGNSPGNLAPNGNQWAELDLPVLAGFGIATSVSPQVFQDVPTVAGRTYLLTFYYTPRPNYGQQILGVFWGDAASSDPPPLVDQTNPAETTQDLNWQKKSFELVATSSLMRLGFGSLANFATTFQILASGEPDAGGNLVDDISLAILDPGSTTAGTTAGGTTTGGTTTGGTTTGGTTTGGTTAGGTTTGGTATGGTAGPGSEIPEPGSVLLLGSGLVLLSRLRLRR